MTRTFIIFLICILTACGNSVSKNQNQLAKDMQALLISGKYDVEIRETMENHKSTEMEKNN